MGAGEQRNKIVPNAENEMNAKAYIKFTLLAIMILMVQTVAWGQTRYYVSEVKGGSNGADDPSVADQGWAFACTDLQKVIDEAYSKTSNGANPVHIWVAEGTYYPKWLVTNNNGTPITTTGTTTRDHAFVMRPNVHIYGGFTDGGTFAQRDWKTNETILSGDIGNPGDADNCYHVVLAINNGDNSATLDGFVIKEANSVDASQANANININNTNVIRRSGAGIYIINSSFAMNNLEFRENAAQGSGGAICAEGNGSRLVTLSNSIIRGNRVVSSGGGIYSQSTSWEIKNVLFSGNTAATGGAISFGNTTGTPKLTNVTIAGNYASTNNSGGISGGSNATLYNTIDRKSVV